MYQNSKKELKPKINKKKDEDESLNKSEKSKKPLVR